jgi:amino acid transporter
MSAEHAMAKAPHTGQHTEDQHGLSEKGLKAGSVGLIGAVVIGVSCIAPAYTLTAALGPTVAEVGVHLPAIFLVGFVPMLLVAFGYRELNNAMPDAGTSFTWASKAFGPRLGAHRGDHHRALESGRCRGGFLLPDAVANFR